MVIIDDTKIQKPFLKWVGGKSEILDKVFSKFPTHITNYHEIFLGGGSVLLCLLSLVEQKKITVSGKIYASDFNEKLINVYKSIQSKPKLLSRYLDHYMNIYNNSDDKQTTYYELRELYNTIDNKTMSKSALFIILNKLCFRGLYRENKKGYFNVSFGNYKKPLIPSKDEILKISSLIKNVIFTHQSFTESLHCSLLIGDFVYLDPPYLPENYNSFTGYNGAGFDKEMHKKLFYMIKLFKGIKINFLMSNSYTDNLIEIFKLYPTERIIVSRRINSKKPQSKTYESLIYNEPY
jgi:DNA adenine methylase